MSRFMFEVHEPRTYGENGRPYGVHAGNLRVVEIHDAHEGAREYLGSINMTADQHAALVAELTGVAAVRVLHRPCHADRQPPELCVDRRAHASGPQPPAPLCVECGKRYPCPTTEVLPS
jgi:hypothetical protein